MISTVKVTNFKGIRGTVTLKDAAEFVIFEGGNRQGKTSMIEGIRWAIVGGADSRLINHDEEEMRVTLTSDSGSVIERSLLRDAKKNRLSITAKERTVEEPEKFLATFFSPHCFDPIHFCHLSGKEQAAIIRTALSSKISMTPEECKACGFELQPDVSIHDQLTKWYKHYYDERKTHNARIDQYEKTVKFVDMSKVPTEEEVAEMQEEVDDLNDKLDKARKHNAKIEAAASNRKTKEKLEKDLGNLNELIEKLSGEGDVKKLTKDLDKKKKELKASSDKEAELRGQAKQLEKTLDELGESKFPICPISKKITCCTDVSDAKSGMEKELKELKAEVKKLNVQNSEKQEEVDALQKQIDDLNNLATKTTERDRVQATIESLSVAEGEAIDTSNLLESLSAAQKKLSDAKSAIDISKSSDIESIRAKQAEADGFVKEIRRFQEEELPKRAQLGIPDVVLEDDGIYFKDTLLSNESTATQVRLAVAIMRALFPKNNILTLDRIESIDINGLKKLIENFLRDGTRQVFATYVGTVPREIREIEGVSVHTFVGGKIQ